MPELLHSHLGGAVRVHDGAASPLQAPADLRHYATIVEAPAIVVGEAVERAQRAFLERRRSTLAERAGWLEAAAGAIEAAAEQFVALIVNDIGKPRRAARFETQRAAQFMRACAVEVRSLRGEVVPTDSAPAGAGHLGFTRRVPYGVVAAITPFNAPLNLLVQKVGPALAVGNSVVAKPHPAGSRVALLLARAFQVARLPDCLFNVVTGDRDAARTLVEHPLVAAVSYTGSTAGGDALVRAAGAKKFVAELGSNAANIVLADADIHDAASRIAAAAFEASGQQCISAQRIIVEDLVYDDFLSRFVEAAAALKMGPPDDATIDLGPMITPSAADRVMAMCDAAISGGARYVLKPSRRECFVSPGILVDAPRDCRLWNEEVFGPVAVVQRARDVTHALELANESKFGLQGAVFTRSLRSAYRFADEFDVGSLWVNEASRFRLDMYPFGGVKRSGFGREGVRYAMEDLSQHKFIGLRVDV